MEQSHITGYEMPLSVNVSLPLGCLSLFGEMLYGILGAGWVGVGGF